MQAHLSREDLYSLEDYARLRPEFRARVMEHKQHRVVQLGAHLSLHFEDRLTMQYQIQEMLRVERIFEPEGIQEELAAYNPLIPDGANFKATLMIQYPDVDERKHALERLLGVEDQVWVQVAQMDRVQPIADEDMDRENDEKTSSVHFLRFELTPEMIVELKQGASLSMGVSHPEYQVEGLELDEHVRESLVADLA